MDLFVHDDVKGTVTLRLENRTAEEVISILIQANGLAMDEVNGVFFVRTAESKIKLAAERSAHPARLMFDAYLACGLTRQEALQLMIRLPGGASFLGEPSTFTEGRKRH